MKPTQEQAQFISPPKSNTQISFGKGANMHIQFYAEKKPNKLQRWALQKVFGIYLEDV